MFVRPFRTERFLRSVYGTETFVEYCRRRAISFEQTRGAGLRTDDLERWKESWRALPCEKQVQVQLELAKVNDMAAPTIVPHFLDALAGQDPPPDSVPAGAPLALWFSLYHPDLFENVFFHEEMREQRIWRHAHAPAGILLNHLDEKAVVLASRLQEFFRIREGSGRFCRIHAYPQHEGACFAAVLADRVQQFNTFTETGEYTTQWLRPTFSVCFVYYADGSLLLKSRLRASDRLLELLRCFGKAVLGVELPEGCLRDSFHLDRLTHEFQPLPDAEDMELIRIRSIQFGYPQRKGRPQVKVKTLSSDGHAAIEPLLRTHLPRGGMLDPLHVSYAELQIRLRIEGQSRNYLIRLWPNASNLNPTPLGERLRACLKRWGLLHV